MIIFGFWRRHGIIIEIQKSFEYQSIAVSDILLQIRTVQAAGVCDFRNHHVRLRTNFLFVKNEFDMCRIPTDADKEIMQAAVKLVSSHEMNVIHIVENTLIFNVFLIEIYQDLLWLFAIEMDKQPSEISNLFFGQCNLAFPFDPARSCWELRIHR